MLIIAVNYNALMVFNKEEQKKCDFVIQKSDYPLLRFLVQKFIYHHYEISILIKNTLTTYNVKYCKRDRALVHK